MTWEEICEDNLLATLPYRIESDRWGNIVMSPPPQSRHGEYQGEISGLLREKMTGGRSLTECPIRTTEGVKAADVAWVSNERRLSRRNDPVYLIAPEICVETVSPSTQTRSLMNVSAFFEKGASEFWLCGMKSEMTFFDPAGKIEHSRLCPGFPSQVKID